MFSTCFYQIVSFLVIIIYLFIILKEKRIIFLGNNSKIDYGKVGLVEINPTTSNEATIEGCMPLHTLPQPPSLVVSTCNIFAK
jgi:hypothetical protein